MASGIKCCTGKIKTKDNPGFGNKRIATDLYKSSFCEMVKKQRECNGGRHEEVREWTLEERELFQEV